MENIRPLERLLTVQGERQALCVRADMAAPGLWPAADAFSSPVPSPPQSRVCVVHV